MILIIRDNTVLRRTTRNIELVFDIRPLVRQGGRRIRNATAADHRQFPIHHTAIHHAARKDVPVGQKTVLFSDLSGELIGEGDAPARIVVHEHPELTDGPVEIEALPDEARTIEKSALRVAVVDLYLPGADEPCHVTMDAGAFDKLATDRPMSELLIMARPAKRSARSTSARSTQATAAPADRVNYASLEHAGKPHKGKITEAERDLVREHFDEINERLSAQGLRTISLSEPEHVERYGLAQLAEERAAASG
jgi:hypothetical protein